MTKSIKPITNLGSFVDIRQEIEALQAVLDELIFRIESFEAALRNHLFNEIIEEQELTVLYKQQKQVKKQKRQLQKGASKPLFIQSELMATANIVLTEKTAEDLKTKKKLYREAMLQVHPDKFSLNDDKLDIASEVTARLIEIYTTGTLEDLKLFHAHIFNGNAMAIDLNHEKQQSDQFLMAQKNNLIEKINAAKNKHTYIVLNTYNNPMSFLKELQDYYNDRLFKLRKRTRSKK